jgi:hypothetical protein
MLPDVRRRTAEAVAEVEALVPQRDSSREGTPARVQVEQRIQQAVSRWIRAMEALGVEVKGTWLVDFDNGRGYYCWRWPEDRLDYSTLRRGLRRPVRIGCCAQPRRTTTTSAQDGVSAASFEVRARRQRALPPARRLTWKLRCAVDLDRGVPKTAPPEAVQANDALLGEATVANPRAGRGARSAARARPSSTRCAGAAEGAALGVESAQQGPGARRPPRRSRPWVRLR